MKKGTTSDYKGSKHHNWRGAEASYNAVHTWLRTNYGSADRCENKKCKRPHKTFQWARLHGKDCVHKRENFVRLCLRCHTKYDADEKWGDVPYRILT